MILQNSINLHEATAFLDDYVQNTKVELVEGKKKSELLAVAKRKGIVPGSIDLGLFRNVYAFTDEANKNGARLPNDIFRRALPTIVMKPINIGHVRKQVVGVYFDYVYQAKEKLAITYGVFFKSYYPKLWAEAQKMMKEGKLKSSYEIWCPDDKKRKLSDGTYELLSMELAGGALLFDDRKKYPHHEPAFDGAEVLELAKKHGKTLEFASFDDSQIIKSSQVENSEEESTEEDGPVNPTQVVDFKLECLNCSTPITHVEEESERQAKVRCESCNSRYELTFAKKEFLHLKNFPMFLMASVNCPQCHHRNIFSYLLNDKSNVKKVTCDNCHMSFEAATPNANERKPIINVKELEPYKPEEIDEPELSGIKSTQENQGVSIDSQSDKTTAVDNKIDKKEQENTQEDEVDKKLHYAAMRKAVKKIRELKQEKAEIESANKSKVEKLEKRVRRACSKIVKANKLVKASREEEVVEKVQSQEPKEKYYRTKHLRTALKALKKVKEDASKQIELYKSSAQTIVSRRSELGEFAEEMSDEQILNDKDFEFAMLKKENAELKAKIESSTTKVEKPEVAKKESTDDLEVATTKKAQKERGSGYYDNPEQKARIDRLTLK